MAILVDLHNIIRWVVVILAVLALVRAYRGWLGGSDYTERDRKIGVYFGVSMDIQLLIGVILWIFGSWGLKAIDMAAGLEGAGRMTLLFLAVEHPLSMVIAVVLVHIGSITAKRAENDKTKHQRTAILFSIAVLLIIIAIPWTQRPLLPGL